MRQEEADFEQRLARFDSLVDRFTLTLHQWRQGQERAVPPDAPDVQGRITILEEAVEREAQALRHLHAEPLRQLQAHTANLGELCVAAAKSVNGLDQAESRLAAMEADLHLHLADLSKNFQTLVTDLRAVTSPSTPAAASTTTWPLDRVVHLHGELRRGMSRADASLPPSNESGPTGDVSPIATAADAMDERSVRGHRPAWWYPVIILVAIAAAASAVVERRLEGRLNEATARAAAAEQHAADATQLANRQIASARDDANHQLAVARRAAERAERVGAILTAPDLVRYPLSGSTLDERLSAQVLWSRARGLVLSASRVPIPPADSTYQLWVWANGRPVSAGTFVPDASGAATLMTDDALKVSGPVTNIAVTVEPSGGSAAPSGRTLLAHSQ